jgi:hypothetical protein
MRHLRRTVPLWIALAALALLPRGAWADEPTKAGEDAERRERLAFMERLFAEFELFTAGADQPCARSEEALLRYSNPVRNFFSDGVTYLWLDGQRPVAAATISIRGAGDVWREFTSLSDRPLRCARDGRAEWVPESGNLINQQLPKAPEPAASSKLRLLQLRRSARRFEAVMQESEAKSDEVKTLRLLAKPLHHWSEPEAGVIEGALFAFCETTDPEAFLVLELVRLKDQVDQANGQTKLAWRYSLARMTSRPLVFRLDGREVAALKGYWVNPRAADDPYAGARLGAYESPAGGETE